MWATYRSGLASPGLLGGRTTDAGWGCTLRSMHMLLANAIVGTRCGWWESGSVASTPAARLAAAQAAALPYIADWPPPAGGLFSLYNLLASSGRGPRWWGPHETAFHAVALAAAHATPLRAGQAPAAGGLRLLLCQDAAVAVDEVTAALQAKPDGVLLLIPARGGLGVRMEAPCQAALAYAMRSRHFAGAVGGTPSHSLYLAGVCGSTLVCLDPHTAQPQPPLPANTGWDVDGEDVVADGGADGEGGADGAAPPLGPATVPLAAPHRLPALSATALDAYRRSFHAASGGGVVLRSAAHLDPSLALAFVITSLAQLAAFVAYFKPALAAHVPLPEAGSAGFEEGSVGAAPSGLAVPHEVGRRGSRARGSPSPRAAAPASLPSPPAASHAAPPPAAALFDVIATRHHGGMAGSGHLSGGAGGPIRSWSADSAGMSAGARALLVEAAGAAAGASLECAGDGPSASPLDEEWDDCRVEEEGGEEAGGDAAGVTRPTPAPRGAPDAAGGRAPSGRGGRTMDALAVALYGGGQAGATARGLFDAFVNSLSSLFPLAGGPGSPAAAASPASSAGASPTRDAGRGGVGGRGDGGSHASHGGGGGGGSSGGGDGGSHGSASPGRRPAPAGARTVVALPEHSRSVAVGWASAPPPANPPAAVALSVEEPPHAASPDPADRGGAGGGGAVPAAEGFHMHRRSFQGFDLCVLGEEGDLEAAAGSEVPPLDGASGRRDGKAPSPVKPPQAPPLPSRSRAPGHPVAARTAPAPMRMLDDYLAPPTPPNPFLLPAPLVDAREGQQGVATGAHAAAVIGAALPAVASASASSPAASSLPPGASGAHEHAVSTPVSTTSHRSLESEYTQVSAPGAGSAKGSPPMFALSPPASHLSAAGAVALAIAQAAGGGDGGSVGTPTSPTPSPSVASAGGRPASRQRGGPGGGGSGGGGRSSAHRHRGSRGGGEAMARLRSDSVLEVTWTGKATDSPQLRSINVAAGAASGPSVGTPASAVANGHAPRVASAATGSTGSEEAVRTPADASPPMLAAGPPSFDLAGGDSGDAASAGAGAPHLSLSANPAAHAPPNGARLPVPSPAVRVLSAGAGLHATSAAAPPGISRGGGAGVGDATAADMSTGSRSTGAPLRGGGEDRQHAGASSRRGSTGSAPVPTVAGSMSPALTALASLRKPPALISAGAPLVGGTVQDGDHAPGAYVPCRSPRAGGSGPALTAGGMLGADVGTRAVMGAGVGSGGLTLADGHRAAVEVAASGVEVPA
jgi:hypothetical protein